jgi:hypothetical protein
VDQIALLQRASRYITGCSIRWSINLRLSRAKLVAFLDTTLDTAPAGDALSQMGISKIEMHNITLCLAHIGFTYLI